MSTSALRANMGYEYSADFQEADMSHTVDGLASTFIEPLEKKLFPNDQLSDTSALVSFAPNTALRGPIFNGHTMPTQVLAEWSGVVTEINSEGSYFGASLKGIKGDGVKGEEEHASIPTEDISEWDSDLLKLGNYFRLCVVHEISPSGQPRRYTQVVFRRMPAYRQVDLDLALERGKLLASKLRVE